MGGYLQRGVFMSNLFMDVCEMASARTSQTSVLLITTIARTLKSITIFHESKISPLKSHITFVIW